MKVRNCEAFSLINISPEKHKNHSKRGKIFFLKHRKIREFLSQFRTYIYCSIKKCFYLIYDYNNAKVYESFTVEAVLLRLLHLLPNNLRN